MHDPPPNDTPLGKRSARPRRVLWLAVPAVLLLAGGAYLLFVPPRSGDKAQAANPSPRPVAVVAEAARKGDIRVFLNGMGTVTPLATVTVRSRVDGQLMAVHFQEGQVVRKGDPLAEIDTRPFEVQLTQAEGQMARDQALLTNARLDLERDRELLAKDSVSQQEVSTQEALVRQYEGAVRADQGRIDDINLQLSFCHLTAPAGGRLGLRLVDPGNIVRAEDPGALVVITQMEPIAVVFGLPADSLPRVLERLKAGETLTVEALDREQARRLATGSLLTIDNAIDPATGTVRLKAQFANDDGALFPNQFVNSRLLLEVRRDVVLVPRVAVQRGQQGTFVYVVLADDTVEVRPVQVGIEEGEAASIDSGVAPGEVVVIEGADALRKGSRVIRQAPRTGASAIDKQ